MWAIMRSSPRVCVPVTEGNDFSALLEAEPVPLAYLKTIEASIRLIVNTNKQNDCAVIFLILQKLAAILTIKCNGACWLKIRIWR